MIYGNRPPSESNLEGGFIMFKKSLAIVLVAAMTLGLTGCFQAGSNGGADTLAPVNTSAEAGAQKEETSRHEETTEAVSSETASSEASEKGSEIAPSVDKGTEESKQDKVRQVLIDNDTCRLEWVSFKIEENGNNVFNFRFENKTADTALFFYTPVSTPSHPGDGDVAVNGYVFNTTSSMYWNENTYACLNCREARDYVDPGQKSDWRIIISAKDLKILGMKTVDRLDLPIIVQKKGDYRSDPCIVDEKLTLYPTGLNDASFSVPERASAESDRVIAENGIFKFAAIGTDEKSVYDVFGDNIFKLYFYVQNDSDDFMEIKCRDYSINGIKTESNINNLFRNYIPPRSKSLYSIDIYNLENIGIKELNEIAFVSRVNKFISPGTPDKMAEESVSIDLTGLRKPD